MTAGSQQSDAQRRAGRIRAFREELAHLAAAGVCRLTPEQARAVNRYHDGVLGELYRSHDVDLSDQARHLSLGMQIVSFLGAWALAASVFFFFYQYWGYLGTLAQVTVLMAAPLLTLAVTLWVRERDSSGYFAKLAALIAFACLVINVTQLGVIFNLPASPNALAVFAAYGFVLAYRLNIRLLLGVAILCVFAFIGARTATWSGAYWLSAGEHPEHFILPTLALFALPDVISQRRFHGFTSVYQVLSLVGFFVVVLILANWGRASYLPWSHGVVEGFYQVLGFAGSAAAVWWGMRRGWAPVMVTGNVFFALFLYTKFFDWWWGWLPKSVFFLLIGLTAILALVVFTRLRRAQQDDWEGRA